METENRDGILIVGGYGVFGGRLAQLLIDRGDARVLIAGRSLSKALAFCATHGGEPVSLDRDADISTVLEQHRPRVVIDAAGPFQSYGGDPYRLARACIEARAHYLDLSDDADFTAGIAELDELARAQGVVALSGVSSVPAISSAAVRELSKGLQAIELIDTVILPGNQAPRGLSVMQAILAQAGHPMSVWRDRRWTRMLGWSDARRIRLNARGFELEPRWASYIGCPDLKLFPQHFRARSVTFRAGLELSILHLGLSCLAWLPRLGLVRSLAPWAPPLRWMADRFKSLGSDRGGMRVTVVGRTEQGALSKRQWSLIAEAGRGPFVPTLPAFVLSRQLIDGGVEPGARPCLEELSLDDVEAAGAPIHIRCGMGEQTSLEPLYASVLGEAWPRLPAVVRDAHELVDQRRFSGESRITTGTNLFASIVRWCMRFPPAGEGVPVSVTMERVDDTEHWTRQFGRHRFKSVLSRNHDDPLGHLRERFGPMQFGLSLPSDSKGLQMPIHRGWFIGIPLPRFVLPRSDTREFVDDEGRFNFDVDISLPLIGRVVRYQGWLRPVQEDDPT